MHIFISYAKLDTYDLALQLSESLRQLPGVTVWMDESLTPGISWAAEIAAEINRSDLVVVLLSPDVNRPHDSERGQSFVINEIEHAQRRRKPIIPVMAQSTEVPIQITTLQYIDFTKNHTTGLNRLTREIAPRAAMSLPPTPPPGVATDIPSANTVRTPFLASAHNTATAPSGLDSLPVNGEGRGGVNSRRLLLPALALVALVVLAVLVVLPSLSQRTTPTVPAVGTTQGVQPTFAPWSATFFSSFDLMGIGIPVTGIDDLNFNWGAAAPTINGVSIPDIGPKSFSARFASMQTFKDGIYNFVISSEDAIRVYFDGALLVDRFFARPLTTDTFSLSIAEGTHSLIVEYAKLTGQAILQVQWVLISTSKTDSSPLPPTATPSVSMEFLDETLAFKTIVRNADWAPIERSFDGIDMALVPIGCFQMGSEDEVTDRFQCVEKPYWIDKTEVSNLQFGSGGYFKGDYHPRDSVSWIAARGFCAARDARLPTELEWEFAARGPDNLLYPWGNTFLPNIAVFKDISMGETANVGGRLEWASWVGALDMSGNVFEWTSSIIMPYPYSGGDGREDSDDTIRDRVFRGGSLLEDTPVPLWYRNWGRITARPSDGELENWLNVGFRCARDY